MNIDFHYYATYCAALLAGYTPEESLDICYSAQLVDLCSRTFLGKLKAPLSAATTQLQLELMECRTDMTGLQDITRIWASFHFLPADLYAVKEHCSKRYLNKYRLICGPNGDLLADTVNLAKNKGLQAAGIAMHILADTWAHRYFAGTPSLVINNTDYHFFELITEDGVVQERPVSFRHNPSAADDPRKGIYINSVSQNSENSIMNLGHGRAGHLPDYSFIRYKYLPAWGDFDEILKDNPSDFRHAFCQMIYALKYLRGEYELFEKDRYDEEAVSSFSDELHRILNKRQTDACEDWKALALHLDGHEPEPFDLTRYEEEYLSAEPEKKGSTFLGRFFQAAMAQKSMVTNKIFHSGNLLAGFSVDFDRKGFRGIEDFKQLIQYIKD